MRPEIIKIWTPFGDVPIHGYGLMIVIGFLAALVIGRREVRRLGLPDYFSDLAMAVLLAGILGGRIFYYVEFYQENYAGKSFLEFFKIWEGGLVFYGGAVGGVLGGLGFLLWKKLPIAASLDVVSLVAPIGMGIGRIGCFLNGCCYGRLSTEEYPLGVIFPPTSPAALRHAEFDMISPGEAALPVHPVQLYQAAHDLLLFLLMWFFLRRASPPRGAGMPFLFVLYGIGRFFLEGLRGDHRTSPTGLTISQSLSLALVAVFATALSLIYWKAWRGRQA